MKEIKRTFLEKIKLFLSPMKENKIACYKGCFVSFITGISGIAHVIFLERLAYYLELGNQEIFFDILIYYIIYIFAYEIIYFSIKKWGWVELFGLTWITLSNKYMKQYMQLDNNRVESIGTGKLIAIIHGAIKQWGFMLWNLIEISIGGFISILFGFYMVSKINIYYGFVFIILIILFTKLSTYFNDKLKPYRIDRNENTNHISKYVVKILMNKTEILQTNKTDKELEYINTLYGKDINLNQKMGTYRTLLRRNSEFVLALLFVIGYVFLGKSYFLGEIGLNVIVGFGGALILMQRSIDHLLSFYVTFSREFVVIDKLWDFFDTAPVIQGYEDGKDFLLKRGNIEIKNINFSYIKNTNIFTDFSLNIKGGKILALVGNSGSGKSTLAKMIAGYMKPDSGNIIIDNQNLSDVSLKSYYRDIGYLTQDPSVFDGTILENLTYALEEEIGDKKIKEIIILAKCEFIYDLPNGLDTQIGERGVKLSGGQKQRLAIAKIFLKDPKIIILDEPTSALDSFSEEQITKAMHNLFENRTVIIIAHRLQTVKNADKILVLEQGKIIEEGKHDELVKKGGQYAKMLELQSGF